MKYQRYIWGIAALLWMIAALLAGARTTQAGPISPLSLTVEGGVRVIQRGNGQINAWATTPPGEVSLAIDSTVRTYSQSFTPVQGLESHKLSGGVPA